MDRTNGANYDASSGVRKFTDGPPGTTVEKNFLNGVQEELIHSIDSFAITPSISDNTQLMQGLGLLGNGMRNGIIVPTVAANNLTVSIKNLIGSDPSTTNPVYARIGNYIRKITSALYVTVTGGTNTWRRTSSTYDVFVYLGWDSVNQRVEICLCPRPTYLVYPAANPAAPSALRIRSAYGANVGTAIASGHTMQLIGRIDSLVQSAADNYSSVTSTAVSDAIAHGRLFNNLGGMELLQTLSITAGDASIGTKFIDNDIYSSYKIIGYNLIPVNNAVNLLMRVNVGGVPQSGANDYYYRHWRWTTAGSGVSGSGGNTALLINTGSDPQANSDGLAFEMMAYNMPSTTYMKRFTWLLDGLFSQDLGESAGGSYRQSANAVDGFTFLYDVGNMSAGVIKIYGLK